MRRVFIRATIYLTHLAPTGYDAARPLRLVDIMELFEVSELLGLMMTLNHAQCACVQIRETKGAGAQLDEVRLVLLAQQLGRAFELCRSIGFNDAFQKIGATLLWLEHSPKPDVSALEGEIRNVYHSVLQNSFKFQFLQVEEDRIKYLTAVTLFPFGEVVNGRFPSAHFDICEAAECLALEHPTATVFHLMRAVEWALRALCIDVGMTGVQKFKKSRNAKLVPIEYSVWEEILKQIPAFVAKKMEAIRPTIDHQGFQELQVFYNSMLLEIQAFKNAFRNHVMHAREAYTREDALAIFEHVRRFMTTLSERISEC